MAVAPPRRLLFLQLLSFLAAVDTARVKRGPSSYRVDARVLASALGTSCKDKSNEGTFFGSSSCATSWKDGRCAWVHDRCVPNCEHLRNQAPKRCQKDFCDYDVQKGRCHHLQSDSYAAAERVSFCANQTVPLNEAQALFCHGTGVDIPREGMLRQNGEGEWVKKNSLRVSAGKYVDINQRIAVVGAGPAGLHIARELQKRGFTNITILEMTDRVGGKSYTRYLDGDDKPCTQRKKAPNGAIEFDKKCVPIEYGTCFLHNGYHRVRELVHEYGIRHEGRTANVLTTASGFDFARQIDAEHDHILRTFKEEELQRTMAVEKVVPAVAKHLRELWAQLMKPEHFRDDIGSIARGMDGTLEVLTNMKLSQEKSFEENFVAFKANLSQNANVLYHQMDKGVYETWLTGSYTMHVTELVIKGQKMRGLSTTIDQPFVSSYLPFLDAQTKLFVSSILKYVEKREEVFGIPKFKMPKRLSDATLKDISKTFQEWLVDHGLQSLVPFFQVAHAAQGYGYLWEVPAYYGLSWMSPDFVIGVFAEAMATEMGGAKAVREILLNFLGVEGRRFSHLKQVTTMLPEGYHAIWREMHNVMTEQFGQDPVHFEITDLAIDRRLKDPDAPVSVTWKGKDGSANTKEFDFVMYTGPLKYMEKYVADTTALEKDIFDKLEAFTFAITLYRSNTTANPVDGYTNDKITGAKPTIDKPEKTWQQKYMEPVTLYNADNIVDGPRSDFNWYVDRNDPRQWTPKGEYKEKFEPMARRIAGQFASHEVHLDIPGSTGERLAWWGSGAPGSGGMPDTDKIKSWLLEKLKVDMKKRGMTQDIEVLEQVPWPYFWHFTQEEIKKGAPWDLLEMQGKNKMWYLGASSSFESIDDIVNYNLMLLDKSAFEGHRLKNNSEFGADEDVQALDALHDTDSKCCCETGEMISKERACALVPQVVLIKNGNACPRVARKRWPMSVQKDVKLVLIGKSILNLFEDVAGVGCKNLENVIVLTNDAYRVSGMTKKGFPAAFNANTLFAT